MVLCEFFLNGNCRFGSRCNKDHIDLKTLIKSEVTTAVTGKQWMLSCFGPFKGSVCVPNFIPDRSFEEVRLSYLEAKKMGNIQGHTNELVMQYNDAMTKMNQLKNCPPDTIPLLVNIYNQSILAEQNKSTKTLTSANNNVFGASSTTANPSNVFGQSQQQPNSSFMNASSIFGGSQQPQPTPQSNVLSAGSIFGSSQTANPFQSTNQSTSMFGAPKPAEQPNSSSFSFAMGGSPFDQQQQQPQSQNQSIFGSAAPASGQTGGSIFGGTSTFGQPAALGQPSGNIFAMNQPQQQQPQQQVQSSPFGGSTAFGSSSAAPSIFGQSTQQQQPQSTFSSPFGGTNTFGTPPIAAVTPTASIFAPSQPQQQTQASIFGSSVASQPDPQAQTQPSTGIFGSFSQQQSGQQSANVFTQAQNPLPTQSNFQTQPSSVFGQIQSTQPPSSGSIFQINQSNQASSTFANPFVTQPQQQQRAEFDESVYSDPSALSQAEIAAYQADEFEYGKIPLHTPARQFCF